MAKTNGFDWKSIVHVHNPGEALKDIGGILFIVGMFTINPIIAPIGAIAWGAGKLLQIFVYHDKVKA